MIAWEWLMLAYLAGLATAPVYLLIAMIRAARRGENWFHG